MAKDLLGRLNVCEPCASVENIIKAILDRAADSIVQVVGKRDPAFADSLPEKGR